MTITCRTASIRFDIVLVGGGLQNGLIALAVLQTQPQLRIAMFERSGAIGGNHTWCFHAGDVPRELAAAVAALTMYRWKGYTVRFPGHERVLSEPYSGTSSTALDAAVRHAFARSAHGELHCGVGVREVAAHHIELETGEIVQAALIIDARGPQFAASDRGAGYQKFVGLELALARPHGLARPVLMDATVPQLGGFRFFYVLPLAPDRVLVEDTVFSRTPDLDVERTKDSCLQFAATTGLSTATVVRVERGVLPLPWRASYEPPTAPLRGGYLGGWFHPTTGYSFPIAARLAAFIAAREPHTVLGADLGSLWRAHMRQIRFCHFLNSLLFNCFEDVNKWHVFDRFYRLPEPVIRRFYALETTRLDRARILIGRPPRGFSLPTKSLARYAP